jgi:Zn-dependent peptidase ImmA (M78 family)
VAHSIETIIEPDLLVWARESSGLQLETAAKKVGVKPGKLADWESGKLRPTVVQARRAAKAYRRPLATLFMSRRPSEPFTPTSVNEFRKGTVELSSDVLPSIIFAIRKAYQKRAIALELLSQLDEKPREFPFAAAISDKLEDLGRKVREVLSVSPQEQFRWSDAYEALRSWRKSVENIGVLVLQSSDVSWDAMRGCSLALNPLPVIILNSKDTAHGKIFTLFHEVGHIALKSSALCDLNDQTGVDKRAERFCNGLAAAVLVPEQNFQTDLNKWPSAAQKRLSDSELDEVAQELSKKYRVSEETIVLRMAEVGAITFEAYWKKRQGLSTVYRRLRSVRAKGGPPPHRRALANNGPFFSRLVLDAYNQGHITESEVCDYLEVRTKQVSKIEDALLQGSFGADGA